MVHASSCDNKTCGHVTTSTSQLRSDVQDAYCEE